MDMNALKVCFLAVLLIPTLLFSQDHCKIENPIADNDQLRVEEIRNEIYRRLASGISITDTLITVPVAVHFKDLEGGVRACFEEMALSQIEVLNRYFNRTDDRTERWRADSMFYPGVPLANLNVEFKLANKNHPDNVDHGLLDGDYAVTFGDAFLGSLSDIDWAGYLNIVCFFTSNTGIGTYGSSPIFGDPSIGARLRVNQSHFGKEVACDGIQPTPPFHLGGIAAHEIGHFLGLDHTFTGSCDTDDGVEDTPNQLNETLGNPEVGSVSSCNEVTMTMNIMDYTDDEGIYMFTKEQGDIMRNYLEMISSSLKKDVFLDSLSSAQIERKAHWTIYPNPALNLIHIKSDVNMSRIQICNGLGSLVIQEGKLIPNLNAYKIDISSLPSGFYFVKMYSGNSTFNIKSFYKP